MTSWEDLFATRKWRVATELSGTALADPGTELNDGDASVVVKFARGYFEITGATFHSPLSSARGRRGVLLQEVEASGRDIPGSRIAVGKVVLGRARREGAILEG
jgi:hypothetical protein